LLLRLRWLVFGGPLPVSPDLPRALPPASSGSSPPALPPHRLSAGKPVPTPISYAAPGPEALLREQTLHVLGGGPSDKELKLAHEDLQDVIDNLGRSGSLTSPGVHPRRDRSD
jgi:hypothetical protein